MGQSYSCGFTTLLLIQTNRFESDQSSVYSRRCGVVRIFRRRRFSFRETRGWETAPGREKPEQSFFWCHNVFSDTDYKWREFFWQRPPEICRAFPFMSESLDSVSRRGPALYTLSHSLLVNNVTLLTSESASSAPSSDPTGGLFQPRLFMSVPELL